MHTGSSWITARSTVSKKDLFFVVNIYSPGDSSRLDFPQASITIVPPLISAAWRNRWPVVPTPIYMQLELHNPWRLGHRARVSRRVDTRREMPRQASIRREAPRVERPTEMASISVLAAERFRHSHTDGTLRRASVRTPPSLSLPLFLHLHLSFLFCLSMRASRLDRLFRFRCPANVSCSRHGHRSTPKGLDA